MNQRALRPAHVGVRLAAEIPSAVQASRVFGQFRSPRVFLTRVPGRWRVTGSREKLHQQPAGSATPAGPRTRFICESHCDAGDQCHGNRGLNSGWAVLCTIRNLMEFGWITILLSTNLPSVKLRLGKRARNPIWFRKITPPATSGDRTTARTLVCRPDRGDGGQLRRGKCKHKREQKPARPLTCWCPCCWRLLFHLCVVIPTAPWDGSSATSSPNYFAVNHNRFPDILRESLISTMCRVPSSASLVRENACLAVGGWFALAHRRRPVLG